jgi:hypothetical protein
MDNKVHKAEELLIKKCGVIPKAWSMVYGNCYFFLAFSKDLPKNKWKDVLDPFYLVDLKERRASPFSRMMDPEVYDNAIRNLKKL